MQVNIFFLAKAKAFYSANQSKTLLLFLLTNFFFSNFLASEEPQPTQDSIYTNHLVVDGDSLWSISRFYDVWIQDIIRINKVKKFASGIPIIGLGSILKIPDYSNDDSYKYYCQIDNFTINLSAEFNTRQLFKQCEKILSKSLDFDLINQSTPDEKFWNIF